MGIASDFLYGMPVFAPQQSMPITTSSITSSDVFARREQLLLAGAASMYPQVVPIRIGFKVGTQDIIFTFLNNGIGLPSWVEPVFHSLAERWGAELGWDGYDAKPTDRQHAVELLNYLSEYMNDTATPPIITPLSDGGIQAEWHKPNQSLEITISSDEPPRYFYYNAATNEEEGEPLEQNQFRIKNFIKNF